MDNPETYPANESAPQEDQTVAVINEAGEDAKSGRPASPDTLAREIEARAESVEVNQALVSQYVAALRNFSHGAVITTLPDGVGGQYDGSHVEIAMSTIEVGSEGMTQTIARMEEVGKHEAYHALHNHTKLMITAPEAGPYSVVIAGEGFETTELVEGVTVAETGDQFVSDEYREFATRIRHAVTAATGIGFNDVVNAVNSGDLRGLDDSARVPNADLVLAA